MSGDEDHTYFCHQEHVRDIEELPRDASEPVGVRHAVDYFLKMFSDDIPPFQYQHHEQPPLYFGTWEASWEADPLPLGNDQDADSNPADCPSMLC
eukprot:756535-Hanusia_phi.AAC.5